MTRERVVKRLARELAQVTGNVGDFVLFVEEPVLDGSLERKASAAARPPTSGSQGTIAAR